jgi:hypothetical protein
MLSTHTKYYLAAGPEMSQRVEEMLETFTHLWWDCPTSLPDLGEEYSPRQQIENEKLLDQQVKVLENLLKHPPQGEAECLAARQLLSNSFFEFTGTVFGFKSSQIAAIRAYGFEEILLEFARQARSFDPKISTDDIYQAGRNLWSMNFVQILLRLPVRMTPSLFAYSMLYPYTDNYLDDPSIIQEDKHRFYRSFRRRLSGEPVAPNNPLEERIYDLVSMVEGEYDRVRYPHIYESLLAIHQAQGRSVRLLQGDLSPYEVDVLGICFEKGGTSVLADGYLVAGDLTRPQQELMFAYGTLTQLVDDLEDTQSDLEAGLMTVFSQTAKHWKLDGVTARTLNFGKRAVQILAAGSPPDQRELMDVMQSSITPVLILSAAGQHRYFNREFMAELQRHFPLRFPILEKERKHLRRYSREMDILANGFIGQLSSKL